MTANEMFDVFEEKGYCIGRNKGTREKPQWFWIAPHDCCAGIVPRKFGFGRDHEQYVMKQIIANPQDWVLGRAIDGEFQPLSEV